MTLTDAEREVLRLTHSGHSTDEIARVLGIASSSVNDRIERARERLGGVRRRTAARLLFEHENPAYPHSNGGAPNPFPVPESAPFSEHQTAVADDGDLREEQSTFRHQPSPTVSDTLREMLDRPLVRLALIGNLALLLLAGMVLLKSSSAGFNWMANVVAPAFESRNHNK